MKFKPTFEASQNKIKSMETFLETHRMDIDCFFMLIVDILNHFYDVDIRFQKLQAMMKNENTNHFKSSIVISKDTFNPNHNLNANYNHYLYDDFEKFIKDNDIVIECEYSPHTELIFTMR